MTSAPASPEGALADVILMAPLLAKKTYQQLMEEKRKAKGRLQAEAKPYHELSPIDEHLNVGDWWAKHKDVYAKHANAARRYLAIPATSAPCERLFSTGGRVLEKRRAALKPDSVRDIVLVHDNIHLLNNIEFDEEIYSDEEEDDD